MHLACPPEEVQRLRFPQVEHGTRVRHNTSYWVGPRCCSAHAMSSRWNRSSNSRRWRRMNSSNARRTTSPSSLNHPALMSASSSRASFSGSSIVMDLIIPHLSESDEAPYEPVCRRARAEAEPQGLRGLHQPRSEPAMPLPDGHH